MKQELDEWKEMFQTKGRVKNSGMSSSSLGNPSTLSSSSSFIQASSSSSFIIIILSIFIIYYTNYPLQAMITMRTSLWWTMTLEHMLPQSGSLFLGTRWGLSPERATFCTEVRATFYRSTEPCPLLTRSLIPPSGIFSPASKIEILISVHFCVVAKQPWIIFITLRHWKATTLTLWP